jgi:uncharacterized repeat protein (TIGR01451 family)
MILDLDNDKTRECIAITTIAALVLLVALPTGVAAADTLFEDDFQSGTINASKWPTFINVTIGGSYYAEFYSGGGGIANITSITITAICKENITISYDRRTTGFSTSGGGWFASTNDDLFISGYSLDNGGTWTQLEGVDSNSDWAYRTYDLPAGNLKIQFALIDTGDIGARAYLDNVTVTGDPIACPDGPREVDLFFLIDGSGSVESANFTLQLEGIAKPLRNESIVPRDGSIGVCVIQFSTDVSIEVPLTPVTNDTIDQINSSIMGITYMDDYTNMSGAFDVATAYLTQLQSCCPTSKKQIIDLSTDGEPNRGRDTMTARNDSIAPGLFDVVNVLGVGDELNETLLKNLVYPQPWNDTVGFYNYIANFSVFQWAMENKIITEIGAPKINVTKTVDSTGPYYTDDNITFNITVCNIGNVNVTNVTVNDPLLGLSDYVLVGTLEPDNCTSVPLQNYTVTEDNVCTGWINNTVNASADYGTQTIYSETFANVSLGYDSGINVTKVAAAGPYDLDDNITYNITVCNIGKLTVNNVTVNDPKLEIDNDAFGTLAPGNCSSKEFNYTVTQDDCTTGWINNTVEVNGTDHCGNNLRATDYWNVTVVCTYKYCISGQKMNETENGLANWTINVKNSTGAIIATAKTDTNGYWQVCGLVPGNYTVCEVLQQGWKLFDFGSVCQNVTLVAENITDLDFMNCECNGSISNFVWLDTNQNGIQDLNESGIEGVIVKLYLHESPATLIGTTVTNVDGFYSFDQLCAGNYSLQFFPPPGFVFTQQGQGDYRNDSNADATGRTVIFTLGDGVVDTTIDAGLYQVPEEVPTFTSVGLIALVSLLATIAAVTITRRKRR